MGKMESVRVQNLYLTEYEVNTSFLTLINQEFAAWACYLETGEWVPGETTEFNGEWTPSLYHARKESMILLPDLQYYFTHTQKNWKSITKP